MSDVAPVSFGSWRSTMLRLRDQFAQFADDELRLGRSLDLLFVSEKELPCSLLARWVGSEHIEGVRSLSHFWATPSFDHDERFVHISSGTFKDVRGGLCRAGFLAPIDEERSRWRRYSVLQRNVSRCVCRFERDIAASVARNVVPDLDREGYYLTDSGAFWDMSLIAFALKYGLSCGMEVRSGALLPTTPYVVNGSANLTTVERLDISWEDMRDRLPGFAPEIETETKLAAAEAAFQRFGDDRFHLLYGAPFASTVFIEWIVEQAEHGQFEARDDAKQQLRNDHSARRNGVSVSMAEQRVYLWKDGHPRAFDCSRTSILHWIRVLAARPLVWVTRKELKKYDGLLDSTIRLDDDLKAVVKAVPAFQEVANQIETPKGPRGSRWIGERLIEGVGDSV